MKKMSLTIKATILGVCLTGIISISILFVPWVIKKINENEINEQKSIHGYIEQELIPIIGKEYDERKKEILRLTGISENKISSIDLYNFDFIGDHLNNDIIFYINLIIDNNSDSMETRRYGVVSVSNDRQELLIYDSDYIGGEVKLIPFYHNEKSFLILCYQGGSGNYLSFDIYSFTGLTIPQKVMTSESFGSGELFFYNDSIFVRGNNHRYCLQNINSKFKLKKYTDRYLENSQKIHVLKIDTTPWRLNISFDEEKIRFQNKSDEGYVNINEIILNEDDIVVIDDNNADAKRYIRYLHSKDDGIIFQDGFFKKMTFSDKGEKQLAISDSYTKWYNIVFLIQ